MWVVRIDVEFAGVISRDDIVAVERNLGFGLVVGSNIASNDWDDRESEGGV